MLVDPRVSVVIATYNRGDALRLLLEDLAKQTYDATLTQVVIIDDGSRVSAEPLVKGFTAPYELIFQRQQNAGAAVARHLGVTLATGEIVIITDDDMRIGPDFIEAHIKAHKAGATVVLGHIAAAPGLGKMPVFERFHAHQLKRFVDGVSSGRIAVRGVHVCTGNLSFRREDYLRVGGFDRTLGRSEDRELGVRFEKTGAKLAFCAEAKVVHQSDHADLDVWLKRAFHYGVFDHRIADKHPEVENADPWRFFFLVSPVSRPLMLLSVVAPGVAKHVTKLTMRAAMKSDALGIEKAAVWGTTLAYGLEYFRGMRTDTGSIRSAAKDLRRYLGKRPKNSQPAKSL